MAAVNHPTGRLLQSTSSTISHSIPLSGLNTVKTASVHAFILSSLDYCNSMFCGLIDRYPVSAATVHPASGHPIGQRNTTTSVYHSCAKKPPMVASTTMCRLLASLNSLVLIVG